MFKFPKYWDKTITIYHKTYVKDKNDRDIPSWKSQIVRRCFFGDVKQSTIQGMTDSRTSEKFVRIPLEKCNISVGDAVVFGTVFDVFPDGTAAEDIRGHFQEGLLVRSIKDNTAAPALKHYYVTGV